MSDAAKFGVNRGDHDSTQPKPLPGGESVTDAVVQDLLIRREYGAKKYGQELRSFDGRDHLLDAYQEGLDMVMYLKQQLMERHGSPNRKDQCYVLANGDCISPFHCPHGEGLPLEEFVRRLKGSWT